MLIEGEIVGWKIDEGDRVWVLERVRHHVVILEVINRVTHSLDPDEPFIPPKFQDTYEWGTRWRPATQEEIENDPRLTNNS